MHDTCSKLDNIEQVFYNKYEGGIENERACICRY